LIRSDCLSAVNRINFALADYMAAGALRQLRADFVAIGLLTELRAPQSSHVRWLGRPFWNSASAQRFATGRRPIHRLLPASDGHSHGVPVLVRISAVQLTLRTCAARGSRDSELQGRTHGADRSIVERSLDGAIQNSYFVHLFVAGQ